MLSIGNKNCKRQQTSYKLDMDQNFEPRDQKHCQLGFNKETEGREKSNKFETNSLKTIYTFPFPH